MSETSKSKVGLGACLQIKLEKFQVLVDRSKYKENLSIYIYTHFNFAFVIFLLCFLFLFLFLFAFDVNKIFFYILI